MKRKRRVGEVICRCAAYTFPHRMLGGECKGGAFVRTFWESHQHDKCADCLLRETRDCGTHEELACQALEGREPYTACPELDEHIRYNDIKLYGANRRVK